MIQGWYYDPLHGHCMRRIRRTSTHRYRITGVYGDDEPNTGGTWYALEVDVVGKPTKGDRLMTAHWSK